jgi:hypothetical protein
MNLEGDQMTTISYALTVKTHHRGNPRNLDEDQIIEKSYELVVKTHQGKDIET